MQTYLIRNLNFVAASQIMVGRRSALLAFCLFAASSATLLGDEKGTAKTEPVKKEAPPTIVFEGKVLPLTDILKRHAASADDDAAKVSRVIECSNGKIYSLVKDDASRMFFRDDRLLRRPVQIAAVQIPGTELLAIKQVRTVIDGKPYEVDYYCAKCDLIYTEPGECWCCGQQVVLRERPAAGK